MEISTLIAIGGLLLSAATFFAGRATAQKNSGRQDGQILSDLGYLKSSTDEIKKRLDKQDDRIRDISDHLTRVEESAKQAHKRIDELAEYHKPR